jgi:multidrug efflux pump subunit AcrB
MKDIYKEFKPSSWAIDNRTSIFLLTVFILLGGLFSFNNLPKEKFPDIQIPYIFISTIYPGTSPTDMENLVTHHIEKELKALSGVRKVTSHSVQDYSSIIVEFNTDVTIEDAKQKVKDAVDKAKPDLPGDLPNPPSVTDFNFADQPILFINLSGDFDLARLKKYADNLKDKIEEMPEINRVDVVGALTREIQINVDMYKMQSTQLTMEDIERAISSENLVVSGGTVTMGAKERSLSVSGQFTNMDQLRGLVLRSMGGATVYLKDIATVKDTFADAQSYARMNGKNVISLDVVKRSGANLIDASDKVRTLVSSMQDNVFPKNMNIAITGDASEQTRHTLTDLLNTIIIGFILVFLILMFFMGATNSLFVALSVPLSMCIAFLVLPAIGYTLNMIVLFAFLLGLGIVVDDAIVVIENTHRIFNNGMVSIVTAAKNAAGEVFVPVLAGTITTLAPFIPLAFWGGIIGKFMHYMPVTLIITLTASLLVAYLLNPVFAVRFMKAHKEGEGGKRKKIASKTWIFLLAVTILALLFDLSGATILGNFIFIIILFYLLYQFVLFMWVFNFQTKLWPAFREGYTRFLSFSIRHTAWVVIGTILLFVFSIFLFTIRTPHVVFFPTSEPNNLYVYLTLPTGTDVDYTDSVTKELEQKVYKVIGKNNDIVQSVISNVGAQTGSAQDNDFAIYPNKSKIQIAFVEFAKRHGVSTSRYMDSLQKIVQGIPGAITSVEPDQNGPPTGRPINIEVRGDDYKQISGVSQELLHYLDSLSIPGVEELKSDLQKNKPEIVFDIDRERANFEGVSTGQIGSSIRTAVYGFEASKYRDNEDEYSIMVRYKKSQRENINSLRNLDITYRDMNMHGDIRQIPISTFTNIHYGRNYGAIIHLNEKPVITVFSNVLGGFNPNEVVGKISTALQSFHAPRGVEVQITGEQADQEETSAFLKRAFYISLMIILVTLITQFNSIGKPLIILTEVIFSIIGVMLGFSIFKMDMSIIMCGIGFVALCGLVVRNGILLVEFADQLLAQGYSYKDAAIEAGKTRMTPVLLTAIATILGLIPLAVGFNIDFAGLLGHFAPHIYFGGDSVAFWGPLSWTMIFGLSFATFLTLVLVPVLYYAGGSRLEKLFGKKEKVVNSDLPNQIQ